ncbi:hypothetical protein B6U98_05085 [Thermoplasmatales archaeon ex4572_165]|nr:MAG: hypothetical protein B6U98_05085 [Thermoplasmatales archaeon ex4572_165]RLF59420.1 MAG: hypothetical protein DRN27_02670 [Thermoplasmata archaeon]
MDVYDMKIILRNGITISIILLLLNTCIITISGDFSHIQEENISQDSMKPGDYVNYIYVDGRIRSYRLHIPPSYENDESMPLVLVLHGIGVGSNAKNLQSYCDMDKKADEEGFITVYPNGEMLRLSAHYNRPIALLRDLFYMLTSSREWNRWDDNSIDDVGFINDLLDDLETIVNVNSSRIYITGISGGGMMAYRLGSELSHRIAAIAPIAGSISGIGYVPEKNESIIPYIIPPPSNPIPVIIFHGMKDEHVPFDGTWKKVFEWRSDELWVYIGSVNESISFWVEHNKCNPEPNIWTSEDEKISIKTYTNESDNTEVVLVTYMEGGHEWFKSPTYQIDANDLIWDFFNKHPLS